MVTTARWGVLALTLALLGGCGVDGPVGLMTPGPAASTRRFAAMGKVTSRAAAASSPAPALLLGRVHTPRTQGLAPVDGARLVLRHLGSGVEVSVRSEADGSFRAQVAAGPHQLRVRAPGHLATTVQVRAPRAEVDVAMLRVRQRAGRVSVNGGGAARARIEIAGGIPTWRREFFADARGRFVLRAPPGLYEVVARAAPGAVKPMASKIRAGVRVGGARGAGKRSGAAARAITLALEPASRLRGVVLHGDKPVAGATVVLMPAHPSSLRWRRTSDERGRFAFPALRHGKYRLETVAAGLLPDVGRGVSLPLEGPLRVRLERGRTVGGVVQDRQGRALGGAMVRAEISRAAGEGGARFAGAGELGVTLGVIPPIPAADYDGSPTGRGAARGGAVLGAWTALSDASGRFELRGLPARKLRLVASLDGYGVGRSAWIAATAKRAAPVLTLTRGSNVAGVVVDERGLPLSGAQVSLVASALSTSASDGADVSRTLLTAADGRFAVSGLLSGARRLMVSVRARGYLPLRRVVDDGDAASLRLVLARAEGQVSGLVVDRRGLPLGQATVQARIGGVTVSARSTSAGRFVLEGVGKRPLVIEARKRGHAPARQRVRPGARAVMMRLEQLQSLELRLVDHRTGAQIQRARVGIDGASPRYVTISRQRGAFALQAARGQRTLRISAAGYAEKTVRVRVDEGPFATRARVELRAAGRVSGVVRDSAGQPVGGARVRIGAVGAVTAADGRFELRGVAEGTRTLDVDHGGARQRVSVSVQADQLTGPLRIHLPPN